MTFSQKEAASPTYDAVEEPFLEKHFAEKVARGAELLRRSSVPEWSPLLAPDQFDPGVGLEWGEITGLRRPASHDLLRECGFQIRVTDFPPSRKIRELSKELYKIDDPTRIERLCRKRKRLERAWAAQCRSEGRTNIAMICGSTKPNVCNADVDFPPLRRIAETPQAAAFLRLADRLAQAARENEEPLTKSARRA